MTVHTIISGFTDEVSDDLMLQIKALKELGWGHIDLRTVNGKNVSSLSDDEFDRIYEQLTENDIEIACFGSSIANWGRSAQDSFELDLTEMKQSVRHMKKAGVQFIRIMSYKVDKPIELGSDLESVIIKNIKQIAQMAEDHGIICLHENCETWGGQSCHHSLRLLEKVNSPALKLVFDTGNPFSMKYIYGPEPYSYQDSYRFFQEVLPHIAYLHIKDGRMEDGVVRYTFPGEGSGRVKEILGYISDHDLTMPISIEPHVAVVYHDPSIKAPFQERWKNFIDYGNQLVALAEEAGITFSRTKSY